MPMRIPMGVLLYICCIFSKHLFIRTTLGLALVLGFQNSKFMFRKPGKGNFIDKMNGDGRLNNIPK